MRYDTPSCSYLNSRWLICVLSLRLSFLRDWYGTLDCGRCSGPCRDDELLPRIRRVEGSRLPRGGGRSEEDEGGMKLRLEVLFVLNYLCMLRALVTFATGLYFAYVEDS